MSITDTLFDITYFKSHTATFKVPSRVSLLELQEIIEAEVAEKKELLPWIKLAKFGDKKTDKGSLRHDANVITITGCECDYDGGRGGRKAGRGQHRLRHPHLPLPQRRCAALASVGPYLQGDGEGGSLQAG